MQNLIASFWRGGIQPLVVKALKLKPRGGIADDVLLLNRVSGQLQLEWRARDVHPWDRDLPPGCQAELFLEQALRDTDAAILNLFQTLPEIEQIAIRVLDAQDSTKVILGGVVTREDALATDASASLRLRLRMLGIQYSRIVDGQLEPLSIHSRPVLAVA
jgi:hypothetical protein